MCTCTIPALLWFCQCGVCQYNLASFFLRAATVHSMCSLCLAYSEWTSVSPECSSWPFWMYKCVQERGRREKHITSWWQEALVKVVYNRWTGLVDWTGGMDWWMEICRKYICSYSQFVLRINYMLLYSTTKYDEGHPVGQAGWRWWMK